MIKGGWAERFWTVIVFKDAAIRGATEGLSFSLLLGLAYLRSKMLLTGDVPLAVAVFFFCRRHACHYSAAGFMHRKRLMIDKRASVQETVQSRQDVARASTLRDRSS